MITNVPTSDDFAEHGLMFLNLAWDAVFELLVDFKNAEEWDAIVEDDQPDMYWKAAKRPLAVAQALAQQGAEFALKAEIARVSPFLLVSAPPRDWPKHCDKTDTAFADFRTIDAQDLVRACNAVRSSPLPEGFVTRFDRYRKTRNRLFHTVGGRVDFSEKEVVRYILTVAHLIRPVEWPRFRRKHLEEMPGFKAIWVDQVWNQLCAEVDIAIELLGYAELLEYFGFSKKQRRYICPHCYWNFGKNHDSRYPRTAQLKPNTSRSTNLHCFVCGNDITVTRRPCLDPACKGNAINDEPEHDYECLTCFAARDQDE